MPDPNAPTIAVTGSAPSVSGYGAVTFIADTSTQITEFTTTLTVPAYPTVRQSTLFLWPGLQPGGANYDPIDNGVLQPVLTWGSSCAPGQQPPDFSTWWVSAQYVNTYGHDPGFTGCAGGPLMSVAVGDPLVMHMYLQGTTWIQEVTDTHTHQSVSFAIDMQNQAQNYAEYLIESYGPEPVSDVVFTNSTLTFAAPSPNACRPMRRGTDDFISQPRVSPNGMHCAIDTVVLRAQNVAATTPYAPGP